MKIERVEHLPTFPQPKGQWDAVWVLLSERKSPRPLESEVLRDLDWRLQGVLSRYLINFAEGDTGLTYVPIEARVGIRFLVIDSGRNLSRKSLDSVSRGINAKKILVWAEDAQGAKWLEKQWPALGKDQAKAGAKEGELEEIAWGDDRAPADLAVET